MLILFIFMIVSMSMVPYSAPSPTVTATPPPEVDRTNDSPHSYSSEISINIGDYIILGKYYDEPILWRCVDVDENGSLMLSDKLLCRKPFDENCKKGTGSHVRRTSRGIRGSNYWPDSNLRSWLRSSAPAGSVEWLCGNAPDSAEKGYADEKGFLADGNFTAKERNMIRSVGQGTLLDSIDAKQATIGSKACRTPSNIQMIEESMKNIYDDTFCENIEETVFLLDFEQLSTVYKNKGILGNSYFEATYTQKAIENDKQNRDPAKKDNEGQLIYSGVKYAYYLRTPCTASEYTATNIPIESWDYVLSIRGTTISKYPASHNLGVRPAFYLNMYEFEYAILLGSGTADDPYYMN